MNHSLSLLKYTIAGTLSSVVLIGKRLPLYIRFSRKMYGFHYLYDKTIHIYLFNVPKIICPV